MASAGGGPALTTVNPDSAYPEGPTVVDGVLYYAEMGNDRVMRFDGRDQHAGLDARRLRADHGGAAR